MALIEINKNPPVSQLRLFALLLAIFTAIVGYLAYRAHPTAGVVVWSALGALLLIYLAVPPWRRGIFLGWIYASLPIGFVVGHVLLGLVYYGLITPIGLVMRLVGYDPLQRRLEPEAKSYWIDRPPSPEKGRYFRQF